MKKSKGQKKSSAKGQSPPQELKVGLHSEPVSLSSRFLRKEAMFFYWRFIQSWSNTFYTVPADAGIIKRVLQHASHQVV